MLEEETLEFQITLSAVFWEKLPEYSIYVLYFSIPFYQWLLENL